MMDIRILSYFLMVAREENITKAAALLHMTQPTLSRQMMQLEMDLGVKLFVRSNHHIVLTQQGQLLKRRAKELVSLAEKTKRELIQQDELGGELSIGSGEYLNSTFLAELLAAFREKYPAVKYELYSGNSDDIKERIERGLLDIGFLLEPVEMSKYEYIRSPIKESWGVFVSEESELSGYRSVTPSELRHYPLIFTQRSMVRKEILNWFGADAEELNIIASGNLPFNLAALAQRSGAAFVSLNKSCAYEKMVYVPLFPKLESQTALAWKRNQIMAPLLQTFLDYAKKYVISISGNEL